MKKYRHELKFIISSSQAKILKHRLSMMMEIDENAFYKDNTYLVRSLYFDSPDNSAYYDKINGVEKRKKYRLRIYNLDDRVIRLERKEKKGNLVNKKIIEVSKNDCENIMNGNYISNDDNLREFINDMKIKHLSPCVLVDYKRLAFTYPIEDTRVTFDENVSSGRFNYNLFSKDVLMYDILGLNEVILEVKFNKSIPSHLARILETIPALRVAISKFAYCYEKKEV